MLRIDKIINYTLLGLTTFLLLFAAVACAPQNTTTGTVSSTSAALTPTQIATTGQQALAAVGAGISVAQSAACQAQGLLNLVSSLEKGGAAQTAAAASAGAGTFCTWTNPAATSLLWQHWHARFTPHSA